jgi:biotin carboxylase
MSGVRHIVLVIAKRSWLEWLPKYLPRQGPALTLQVADDHDPSDLDARVARILGARPDAVVFFSHHDVLASDAELARRLESECGVPTVCHPADVADLAHDKHRMAACAPRVSGVHAIPALDPDAARDVLHRGGAVAAKLANGTEGHGFVVLRHPDELASVVARDGYLLQPFIAGVEYSVNLVCAPDGVQVYEPVFKQSTSLTGDHPCRRARFAPATSLTPDAKRRMQLASIDVAAAVRTRGLLEVEWIERDGELYLLEVNPRLAATMRMVAAISDRNIFAEAIRVASGESFRPGIVPTRGFAAEIPVPRGLTAEVAELLRRCHDADISSRITVTAPSPSALSAKLLEVQAILTEEDVAPRVSHY